MLIEKIKQDFKAYQAQSEQGSSFTALREQAFQEFEKLGFPSVKHEEWKYTNLKPLSEKEFRPTCEIHESVSARVQQSVFAQLKCNRLVFINGTFVQALSHIAEKESHIIISTIASARQQHESIFNQHFGKYAQTEGQALNALNTALLSDGAFVYVPEGKKAEFPVLIYHLSDSSTLAVFNQPRNLIVVEKEASLTVVETYEATGENPSYSNVVTETYVGEAGTLEHYKVQKEKGECYQTNFTQIFQEANTNIHHVTLILEGQLVRNNLHFYMNGEGCNSLLYGLYIPSGNELVDNHTRVDHAKPHCYSDEKYKGILKDQSTAVFNGKIMVHIDAQKTNAYQRNQNILLSDEATVNTKPQLEILADDVKCTHGATIGQLDEEPMFYLRSRGIPEQEARKLLLNAFAADIAERIKIPELVTLLEEYIDKKL